MVRAEKAEPRGLTALTSVKIFYPWILFTKMWKEAAFNKRKSKGRVSSPNSPSMRKCFFKQRLNALRTFSFKALASLPP